MTTFSVENARIENGKVYGATITTTRKVTNDVGEVVEGITLTVDYDGIPVGKLVDYALGTLIIRRQGSVWKKLGPEQIRADIGKTINWENMGKKEAYVKTFDDTLRETERGMRAAGVPEETIKQVITQMRTAGEAASKKALEAVKTA